MQVLTLESESLFFSKCQIFRHSCKKTDNEHD